MRSKRRNLLPEETSFDYLPHLNFIAIINSSGQVELHSTWDENCLATFEIGGIDEDTGEEYTDEDKLEFGEETIYQLLIKDYLSSMN